MSNTSKTRHRAVANPVRNAAMIELRRSGASGSHNDTRDRRARTRSASRNRAVADQS